MSFLSVGDTAAKNASFFMGGPWRTRAWWGTRRGSLWGEPRGGWGSHQGTTVRTGGVHCYFCGENNDGVKQSSRTIGENKLQFLQSWFLSERQIKIPAAAIKDITVATTTNENVDNKVDDGNKIKNHREVLGDESDGFQLLENAIADGIELDDDILDKILEAMEKKEVSKEEKKVKEKKVKEKKVKGKKVKEKKVKEKKAKKASRKLSTSLTN